jgi:hypothetical protein
MTTLRGPEESLYVPQLLCAVLQRAVEQGCGPCLFEGLWQDVAISICE